MSQKWARYVVLPLSLTVVAKWNNDGRYGDVSNTTKMNPIGQKLTE